MENQENNNSALNENLNDAENSSPNDTNSEVSEDNNSELNDNPVSETSVADDGKTADYTDSGEENPGESENIEAQEQPKKKKVFYLPIIITAAILLIAIIFFGVAYLFFDNSVEGAWIIEGSDATSDEIQSAQDAANANTYYIFTNDVDEQGNKIAKLKVGTMELSGTYSLSDGTDGARTLTVSVSYFFAGEYTYEVSGNVFTGKTMTLTSNNTPYKFKSASLPELKVDVPENFEVKDELVGEWNESEYNMTYKFDDKGNVYVNQGATLEVNGTYEVNDSTITIHYLAGEETKLDLEYSFDGDTLILSGLGYEKVG